MSTALQRWTPAALAVCLLACPLAFASTISYQYDSLDRLIQVSYEEGTVIQYSYDPAGNRTQRVVQAATTNLSNGQPISNLSGLAGSAQSYSIDVPSGASSLTIRVTGGVGDIALYVRFGALATDIEYDCYQVGDSAELTCVIANPQAGTYFVTVVGVTDFSGVSLRATYSTENSYVCTTGEDFILTNGPLPGETLDVQGCRTITVDAGAAFGATSRLVLAASESIRFAPGFRIEAGGRLSAAMVSGVLAAPVMSDEDAPVENMPEPMSEPADTAPSSAAPALRDSDPAALSSTNAGSLESDGPDDASDSRAADLASLCAEPPAELAAVAGDQSVQLTWSAVPEGDEYYAFWSLTPGIHPHTAASYLGFAAVGDARAYEVTGLENDQEHYFVVTVTCGGNESPPSVEVAATPVATSELVAGRYKLDEVAAGTVTDVVTGLQWMRCALGQQWDGQGCVGYAETYTYESALQAADVLNASGGLGGFADWRVPTLEELQGLVYCSSGVPALFKVGDPSICQGSHEIPTLQPVIFPPTSVEEAWFWSATPDDPYGAQAWGVDFIRGDSHAYPAAVRGGVRLVRQVAPDDE